jgi:proteasome activator subunit 4
MVPVITSFLPPFDIHLYVPVLFKLWEAFNSEVLNSRLIELCGDLSEEHKTGNAVKWKDVGIWTDAEWTVLVGKALGSMSEDISSKSYRSMTEHLPDVPVGATKVRILCNLCYYGTNLRRGQARQPLRLTYLARSSHRE